MKNLYSVSRHALLCLLVICSTSIFSQQIAKTLKCSTGDNVGFLEYKPPTYNQDVNTRYPVIIFLHGIGERGNGTSQLQKVTAWGIPAYIKAGYKMRFTWNGKTETFLVISPQCPTKYGMWPANMVNDFVNYAKTNLRADPNRIILTGLSMGGGGTMRYVSDANPAYAKNIAAAAPISMPCTFGSGLAAAAAHLPVWLFHAKDDPTASASCSLNALNGLLGSHDASAPIITMWPSGGHNVWYRLYGDTTYQYQDVVSIYEWFLAQNKSLPVNQRPIANAGSPASVPPGVIKLNGAASKDPDGKIVRYVWKKLSGPATGAITTPRGASPATTVTGVTKEGVYKYELAVADNRAAFSRDTVTITVSKGVKGPVPNVVPVANAGTSANLVSNTKVQLNASLSSDKDGWITSVQWTKISGPTQYAITSATALVTEATGLVNGSYVFRVTVTDNDGARSSADKHITVSGVSGLSGGNTGKVSGALTVNAGSDATLKGWNKDQLNASLSSVKNGGKYKSIKWTKVSGPAQFAISSPASLITVATNLTVGVYVFRVTITDNKGSTASDDKTVNVLSVPGGTTTGGSSHSSGALTVNAGADAVLKGWNSEKLNASLSSVKNGGWYKSIKWTKVSGPANYSIVSPTTLVATASNLVVGVYVFRVTMTDNKGAMASDDKTITVISVPGGKPSGNTAGGKASGALTVNAGVDAVLKGWNSEKLNASLSSVKNGGWYKSIKWTKISGPATYTIASPTSLITMASNLVVGVYVFRVTMSDNKGAVAFDDKTITVQSVPANSAAAAGLIANAGSDAYLKGWNQTQLNATLSRTPWGGWITKFVWKKISGPGPYKISSPSSSITNATGLAKGTYVFRVTVTDNRGYSAYDDKIVNVISVPGYASASMLDSSTADSSVQLATNPDLLTPVASVRVFPNPVTSTMKLEYTMPEMGKTFISIYDVSGRCVKSITTQKDLPTLSQQIDVSNLRNGSYYIIAGTGNQRVQSQKFVKQ